MRSRLPLLAVSGMAVLFCCLFAAGISLAAPSTRPTLISPPPESNEALPAGVTVSAVVPDLDQPIAMAFDPTGRLFISERGGDVRLFANGTLQSAPVISFDVDTCFERGLLGLALDPQFSTNHYIYVYYTVNPGTGCGHTINRVVRFTENNGVGSAVSEIFTSPAVGAGNHNGGNIHFGADGKLYISIGDDADAAKSPNVTLKNGKIHRLNPDGSIPADNPVFTDTGALPSLFARGVRNSFDFAFDPTNGALWASENGPSCDDELNHILPGGNYGWRASYPCDDDDPSVTDNTIPARWWIPNGECCEAPTGTEFYSGSQIPAWSDNLFMCAYSTGKLRHMHLNAARDTVTSVGVLSGVTCNMDIATGPDGALYYMQGGGYGSGTIMKIAGAGPTATNTPVPPTATHTTTPTNTATAVGTATPTVTGTPPTPIPSATPPCTISYTDVHQGDFFYEGVRWLTCRGAISGYGDNTFRPYNFTTRGQLVKIVVVAENFLSQPPVTPTFSDVPADNPFFGFVETAVANGIIAGYNRAQDCAGQATPCFRPFANVTRGQVAKVVVLAEGWTLLDPATPTFSDVPVTNAFYKEIETAANHRIISGYDDGTFKWQNSATRGQIAKIVYQAVTSGD